jgi:hypothetical protein
MEALVVPARMEATVRPDKTVKADNKVRMVKRETQEMVVMVYRVPVVTAATAAQAVLAVMAVQAAAVVMAVPVVMHLVVQFISAPIVSR